jgi:hypothetical protein
MKAYTSFARIASAIVLLGLQGCDLFATRSPENPTSEGGTFLQADTPDRVVENLRLAISEVNTRNYRRSLSDGLVFQPTATAQARDAIWAGWTVTEEESYFTTLAAATSAAASQSLELNDQTFTLVDAQKAVLDATYVLTTGHNRPEVPTVFQGRLSWEIEQRNDGLWDVTRWTDQELGSEPSWSDLKAAFSS